jgi:mannose-6-phosphate isomerase-like protein (cupin superfamily)
MAQRGEELDNPVTGQRLIFRRTAADTGGELVEVESVWTAGSTEPIVHLHPKQTEHFEILEGELQARIGREKRTLKTGDVVDVPVGTPHAMWNPGPGQARAVWQTRPALETEQFFETMWKLAADGKVSRTGAPDLLRSAVILSHFADEFQLMKPSRGVQRIVFGVLAPIGRLRGYGPTYP